MTHSDTQCYNKAKTQKGECKKMVSSEKSRIAITLENDLLEQVDFYCQNLNFNRSQFISLILELNIMGLGISLAENDEATMEGLRGAVKSEITKDKEVMESLKGLMKAVNQSQKKGKKNGKR